MKELTKETLKDILLAKERGFYSDKDIAPLIGKLVDENPDLQYEEGLTEIDFMEHVERPVLDPLYWFERGCEFLYQDPVQWLRKFHSAKRKCELSPSSSFVLTRHLQRWDVPFFLVNRIFEMLVGRYYKYRESLLQNDFCPPAIFFAYKRYKPDNISLEEALRRNYFLKRFDTEKLKLLYEKVVTLSHQGKGFEWLSELVDIKRPYSKKVEVLKKLSLNVSDEQILSELKISKTKLKAYKKLVGGGEFYGGGK